MCSLQLTCGEECVTYSDHICVLLVTRCLTPMNAAHKWFPTHPTLSKWCRVCRVGCPQVVPYSTPLCPNGVGCAQVVPYSTPLCPNGVGCAFNSFPWVSGAWRRLTASPKLSSLSSHRDSMEACLSVGEELYEDRPWAAMSTQAGRTLHGLQSQWAEPLLPAPFDLTRMDAENPDRQWVLL